MSDSIKLTLKAMRANRGYSQDELSKVLNVAVTTLRRWEQDTSKVSYHDLHRVCQVLKFPIDYLYIGDSKKAK